MSTLREMLAREGFALTQRFDSVTYKLGAKGNAQGDFSRIDCSGWTSFLANRLFDLANARLQAAIFPHSAKERLNTYSDAQIVALEKISAPLVTSAAEMQGPGFSMHLVGIDTGLNEWERQQQGVPRKYGIDHIYLTVIDPDGTVVLSNSSSSGGGVCITPLARLRGRVFAADVMSLASGTEAPGGLEALTAVVSDPSTEGVPAG